MAPACAALYPYLTDPEIDRVVDCVAEFVGGRTSA